MVAHLLELPLVAAHRDVPTAPAAGHHLEVVADDVADGRRPRPSPSASAAARRTGSSPSRAARGRWRAAASSMRCASGNVLHIGFCRLTCQPWPSSSITPSTCNGIGSSASTASTSSPLAASSATDANVRASGQSRCALGASLLARVDERDDLDVGVVAVRAHVEVVDAAEADERGAHRTVVGGEGHEAVLLQFDGVAGGVVDPDLHVRLALHRALVLDALRVELGDGGGEVVDREAVVVAGRVDGCAATGRAHEVELEVADSLPRARARRGSRDGGRRRGRTARRRSRRMSSSDASCTFTDTWWNRVTFIPRAPPVVP